MMITLFILWCLLRQARSADDYMAALMVVEEDTH